LTVPLARPRLHRPCSAPSAQRGACRDLDLPAHAVAARRLQLPSPSDLLGLRRRGHRTLRAVGRRMDDAGAAVALPTFRHLGHRQRTDGNAARRAMVPALALRTLARRQRRLVCKAGTHNCRAGNCGEAAALFCCFLREETTMRWKISHHGHDPRQVDLLAIIALMIAIVVVVVAYGYF